MNNTNGLEYLPEELNRYLDFVFIRGRRRLQQQLVRVTGGGAPWLSSTTIFDDITRYPFSYQHQCIAMHSAHAQRPRATLMHVGIWVHTVR